jgi:hypothetical protein
MIETMVAGENSVVAVIIANLAQIWAKNGTEVACCKAVLYSGRASIRY